MNSKILITCVPLVREILSGPGYLRQAIDILSEDGHEIVHFELPGNRYGIEEFCDKITGVEVAIIGSEPWQEEKFRLADKLKAVCRYGVGYDAVDLAAAQRFGVQVTNTPIPELSQSVAEHAVGLMIAALRKIPAASAAMKNGIWRSLPGTMISGKTFGIVGFGSIGQRFAKCIRGFGVDLIAYDPFFNEEVGTSLEVRRVGWEELLTTSDIISLHAPNLPENFHMFNEKTFGKMKQGSIFINTSRGSMVDEQSLASALRSGHLAAAALDVWEDEPPAQDNPLLSLDTVVASPHMGADSMECGLAMALCTVRQAKMVLSGKIPDYILTE